MKKIMSLALCFILACFFCLPVSASKIGVPEIKLHGYTNVGIELRKNVYCVSADIVNTKAIFSKCELTLTYSDDSLAYARMGIDLGSGATGKAEDGKVYVTAWFVSSLGTMFYNIGSINFEVIDPNKPYSVEVTDVKLYDENGSLVETCKGEPLTGDCISILKEIEKMKYKFDTSKAFEPGTKTETVLDGDSFRITDKNGNTAAPESILKTGMKIVFGENHVVGKIAVKGDTDGDGSVTPNDARFALRASLGLEEYSAEQFTAYRSLTGETVFSAAGARATLRTAVGLD